MYKRRKRPYQPPPFSLSKAKSKPYSKVYRWLISIVIFVFAIFINQMEDPVGEKVAAGIQYLLSTESDYQPTLQRIVGLGLQMENVDWPLFTNIGLKGAKETHTAMGKVVEKPLKIPLSGKVIRNYGWQDGDKGGYQGFHEGIDIKAELGTPVKAAEKGLVEKIGEDPVLGFYLILDHGMELKTLYGQLEEILVEEGQKVERGDEVATVGQSGAVKEPHLHFEVREKNELIDPLTKFNLEPKTGI